MMPITFSCKPGKRMFIFGLVVTELEAADLLPLVIPDNEIENPILEPTSEEAVLMLFH